MPSPLSGGGTIVLDFAAYCQRVADKGQEVWANVHLSPRTCPSRGAKLCTYHHWFARPQLVTEPCFDLPMGSGSLCQLFRFRLGAHSLPVEQGRRCGHSRIARACPHCAGQHVGDERHLIFECPAFDHIGRQHGRLFADAHSAMLLFMWRQNQMEASSCLLRLLSEHESLLT